MWFRVAGSGLLLLAGLITARALDRTDARALSQLDAYIELLRFIRTQIDLYCLPVGEIFRRCDKELLTVCGGGAVPDDFSGLLALPGRPRNPEVLKLLTSFFAELGGSYREAQTENCDRHIARLTAIRDSFAAETSKRRKLHRTLCLSAAAGLALLLI